jgi:hypothetical protein
MDRMSASVKDWGEVCTVNVASAFLSEFCVCDMTDLKIEACLGRSVLTICSGYVDVLIYIAVLSVPYYLTVPYLIDSCYLNVRSQMSV